ncbi:MAG: hypothetical protein SGILL_008343 [Bacillariaceae sp.]
MFQGSNGNIPSLRDTLIAVSPKWNVMNPSSTDVKQFNPKHGFLLRNCLELFGIVSTRQEREELKKKKTSNMRKLTLASEIEERALRKVFCDYEMRNWDVERGTNMDKTKNTYVAVGGRLGNYKKRLLKKQGKEKDAPKTQPLKEWNEVPYYGEPPVGNTTIEQHFFPSNNDNDNNGLGSARLPSASDVSVEQEQQDSPPEIEIVDDNDNDGLGSARLPSTSEVATANASRKKAATPLRESPRRKKQARTDGEYICASFPLGCYKRDTHQGVIDRGDHDYHHCRQCRRKIHGALCVPAEKQEECEDGKFTCYYCFKDTAGPSIA